LIDTSTRVLIVEDEEDAREILAFYLERIFEEVLIARNGLEGLELYTQYYNMNTPFDLVITDIQMPIKDGLKMIDDITLINKKQNFIIVSAYKDEKYLFRSINLNVLSYFVKPLDIKKIMIILKQIKDDLLIEKEKNSVEAPKIIIKFNELYSYNSKTNFLYKNETIIDLSKKEILLLKALINNIELIKTKDDLKQYIWNDRDTSDATLRTVIKRLKDKISAKDFILSKKGIGYILKTTP
jgi:DNA-binding response OmpR family regulator